MTLFFGSYQNEPDDFIIRWDDIPLNFTWFNGDTLYSGDFIKAGSINFSKTCRDNETLSLVKFWVNTFIYIGFLISIYFGYYKCLLMIIGAYSSELSPPEPEHREIGFKP